MDIGDPLVGRRERDVTDVEADVLRYGVVFVDLDCYSDGLLCKECLTMAPPVSILSRRQDGLKMLRKHLMSSKSNEVTISPKIVIRCNTKYAQNTEA